MDREARLKVFAAAAIAKSITKAAERLDISQPAVSRHIKLLEEDLGCALFRRHGRGIELTYNGERLFDVVNPALNRIDAMVGQLQLSAKSVTGQLRIASVHTLNTYFVIPLLKQTMEVFPDLSLQMLERSSLDIGFLVERGLADVGLAYDTMIASDDLLSIRLHDESMQIFYSEDDREAIERSLTEEGDVEIKQDFRFIAPPAGYALRQLMDQHLGPGYRYPIEIETITLMLDAARFGLGVCILPKNMPEDLIEGKGLMRKDIAHPEMSRSVVLITRRNATSVPLIAHVVDDFVSAARAISNKP